MRQSDIDELLHKGLLVRITPDKQKAITLITSAINRAKSAGMLEITGVTATTVFAEVYEAFRQLGDAKWLVTGYKTNNSHEASLSILIEAGITNGHKLQNLDRFRRIRNKANYEGEAIQPEAAKAILELWEKTNNELIAWIRK